VSVLFLLLAILIVAVFIARARAQRAARRAAAATTKLEVDGWGVKRWLADGRYEEVSWEELLEVRVVTLPKGPWDERVRFVLDGGAERGCIVRLEAAEDSGLLASLGALPAFDHRRLAEVLERTRTGNEVLWARTST
jgi:hypothetical protein